MPVIACPRCRGEIQPTWDWCHHCGFDPDGLRPASVPSLPMAAPAPPTPPVPPRRPDVPVGALVAALVVLALVVVGAVVVVTREREPVPPWTVAHMPIDDAPAARPLTSTTTATSAATPWTPWTAPDGTFTLSLPGPPDIVQQPVPRLGPGATANSASSSDSSGLYAVLWFDLAGGLGDIPPRVLMGLLVDSLEDTGDLPPITRTFVDFAGNPAMDLISQQGKATLQGLALVTGQRVYVFMALGRGASADFAALRDSFQIL